MELKNKVGIMDMPQAKSSSEVFDALLALGYTQREVREIIGKLDAGLTQGEQIKQALKLVGNK
mgnify:FL=1